jgi:hypothetical protein
MADKTEFLTTSSFWFECPSLDGKRSIAEVSGLSYNCKSCCWPRNRCSYAKGTIGTPSQAYWSSNL